MRLKGDSKKTRNFPVQTARKPCIHRLFQECDSRDSRFTELYRQERVRIHDIDKCNVSKYSTMGLFLGFSDRIAKKPLNPWAFWVRSEKIRLNRKENSDRIRKLGNQLTNSAFIDPLDVPDVVVNTTFLPIDRA